MTKPATDLSLLLKSLRFAAHKHRHQRRKDAQASPYINHPIAVAQTLSDVGGVEDVTTIAAAILHDTIEDTNTLPEEIEAEFGEEIRALVEEVTDDKSLPARVRKSRQIENAGRASVQARLVKLADKICNLQDLVDSPPANWSWQRRKKYVDWASAVVEEMRGTHPDLERRFDEVVRMARGKLSQDTVR